MSSLLPHTAAIESAEDFADTWKVLIYDQDCRDIISPLMNIGALRQKGVTLHMLVSMIFGSFLLRNITIREYYTVVLTIHPS